MQIWDLQILDDKCSTTGCIFAVVEQVFAKFTMPCECFPWNRKDFSLNSEGLWVSLASLAQDLQASQTWAGPLLREWHTQLELA